jgi:acetyl-CoA carboxylase biotin carboxyl carrier protein
MSSKGKPPQGPSKPGIDAAAVRELAKLLKETGLTEIEIEHDGARIRVSRGAVAAAAPAPAPAAAVPAPAAAPAASGPPAGAVPSPMVGTVFLSPEPGKPAFIAVGHTVKEGDTLFIVEAMKTMNAITAPRGGKVVEINVADGSPVEFGQTLCVIA